MKVENRIKKDIFEDFRNIAFKLYKEHILYNGNFESSDIYSFSKSLLCELSRTLLKHKSLLIYLNRNPQAYENKIEFIVPSYHYSNDFKWWKDGRDRGDYNSYIIKDIEQELIQSTGSHFPNICIWKRTRYKELILKHFQNANEETRVIMEKQFEEIYDGFPEKFLFFLLGSSENLDALIITGISSIKHPLKKLRKLSFFLSNLILDLQYRASVKRRDDLLGAIQRISKAKLDDELLHAIGNEIKRIYHNFSEIGVFPRIANRISTDAAILIGTDQKLVNRIFDKQKTLIIGEGISGDEKKTILALVAGTQSQYYCDIIDMDISDVENSRHPYYYPTVKETKSQYTIPLIYRNELVGVLNVGMKDISGFLPVDRRVLDVLASHVASELHQRRTILNYRILAHNVMDTLAFIPNSIDVFKSKVENEGVEEALKWLFAAFVPTFKSFRDSMYLEKFLESERIEINEIVEKIVSKDLIRNACFKLKTDFSELIKFEPLDTKEYVNFNRFVFEAILDNIILNAINACIRESKNSENYKPEIKIEIKYIPDDKVVFIVKDNGEVIPEDKIQSIFLPNFRERLVGLDSLEDIVSQIKESGEIKGSGIGLWISDQLIAKEGGVLAFSIENHVKVFKLILPRST